jgi:glycosyltransferase involved in cell wall biosynthesis
VNLGGGAPQRPPQRVCFFGTYAREHTVTRLLADACQAAGIEVVECHRPLWEKTPHKHARYFGTRSAGRLLAQYARHAVALARSRRRIGKVPLYVIGFNGQLDCLLLRLLLVRHPTPIVLAPLVTLSETLVEDRGVFRPGSLRARLAAFLDRASLWLPARVVMDTEAHRRYVIDTFGVAPTRVATWYLGADTRVFTPTPPLDGDGPLRVLFYGSFVPLHGTDTVLQAATFLQARRDIEFVLAGDGPAHQASVAYARQHCLDRVRFLDWMPYERLGQLVASAHVCLGIFGTSPKAQMVIPNKVYQAAAVGRPVVTADTAAVREVFTHGDTAWLCRPGDPAALAEAIETLGADAGTRKRLAARAAALMADRFAPTAQGQRLAAIFAAAAGASSA